MNLLEEIEAASVAATPPMSDLLRRAIDELTAQDVTIGNLEALCHELKDRSAQVVPDGWQLVPKEPTDLMCAEIVEDEGYTIIDGAEFGRAVYRVMLAAAPKPPESTGTQHEGEKS